MSAASRLPGDGEVEEEGEFEFLTTRVYVRPPGSVELEYWWMPTVPRSGPTEYQHQLELEVGLPGRFQVGFYLVANQEGSGEPTSLDEHKVEVRYALADWGQIPANPTFYVELDHRDDRPDVVETKLLLGDEIDEDWHWGVNLNFAHETGGEYENEYELTAAASRNLSGDRFALGAEMKAALVDTKVDRGDFEEELLVGPSLQYHATSEFHMGLATLIGIGSESPEMEAVLRLGYEF